MFICLTCQHTVSLVTCYSDIPVYNPSSLNTLLDTQCTHNTRKDQQREVSDVNRPCAADYVQSGQLQYGPAIIER